MRHVRPVLFLACDFFFTWLPVLLVLQALAPVLARVLVLVQEPGLLRAPLL
jgi:hypothetical protein